jgi:hypothetical protein
MEAIGVVSCYFESGNWATYGSSVEHDIQAWDQIERIAPRSGVELFSRVSKESRYLKIIYRMTLRFKVWNCLKNRLTALHPRQNQQWRGLHGLTASLTHSARIATQNVTKGFSKTNP